jgi:hypothetical protein
MKYLAALPASDNGEKALAKLFAQGTATYVPTGDGTGFPVLFDKWTDLNWLASQLWGGKTFRVVSSATHPNGDPIVQLDNKIIKTPEGALFNLFNAYVTRGPVGELTIGVNDRGQTVPAPSGTLAPARVSFLKDPVVIDNNQSVILNYFEDKSLPIIRRILDEIREVDGVNCKGLYLGRAHVRRCTGLAGCGEVPTALVDLPEHPVFNTDYTWSFWTYFLLNFGQPNNQCDIGPAIESVKAQLRTEGLSADLPLAPTAN